MSRFFSFFLVTFLLFSGNSFAADAPSYLVEDVAVEVSGKSPSGARAFATASARRDAFLILLNRLGMNIDVADNITNDEIADMVRSEQIDNERMAGNRYSATFNIMFAKDFVNHILGQKTNKKSSENTSASAIDQKPIEIKSGKFEESQLLIPVQVSRNKLLIWEEENDWKKAIQKNLSKKSQKRFVVPEPDMDNLAALNQDNIRTIEYSGLEAILPKYRTESAYVLFFNYDTIENKVNIDAFYIRRLHKKQIKLSFINIDLLSQEALLDKVAEKTIEYLKTVQAPENKALNANLIQIEIPIMKLDEWLEIKGKLENSSLISQLNIETISRDRVSILVNYPDAATKIEDAFSRVGISLEKKSENSYIMKP